MGTVHRIADARKRREEQKEVMHLVDTKHSSSNSACAYCRECSVCKTPACNERGYLKNCEELEITAHKWTSDHEAWMSHTNPCTAVPIIGGPDTPASAGDAPGDTFPGPGDTS